MRHYKKKISIHSKLWANELIPIETQREKKEKTKQNHTCKQIGKTNMSLTDLWDIDKLTDAIEFLGVE